MDKRRAWCGLFAGLVAGVVGAFTISGSLPVRRAVAQAPAAEAAPNLSAVGRYQVTSWAYPAGGTNTVAERASFGAYVLDTQTGDLWRTIEEGELVPVPHARAKLGR